jgi:hypothetical protein
VVQGPQFRVCPLIRSSSQIAGGLVKLLIFQGQGRSATRLQVTVFVIEFELLTLRSRHSSDNNLAEWPGRTSSRFSPVQNDRRRASNYGEA